MTGSLDPVPEMERLRARVERAEIRASRLADDLERVTAERDELRSRIEHNAPSARECACQHR